MMIAPTLAGPSNFSELWGSYYDTEPGYNNRLSKVHVKASYAIREAYYKKWSEANVSVLGYFNGWELGQNMKEYPPKNCPSASELWRSAPCFIHMHLDGALCMNADGKRNVGQGGRQTWDGDTMLDPAHPKYAQFLKTMVENHLKMEPSFMGLASDGIRACTNYAGDDGISCAGASCRRISDGFTAWAGLMNTIGPMLQTRDKLFSANTVNGPRIHLMRHADLFITEQNAASYSVSSANAFLGLKKPGVMWTTGTETSDRLGSDSFFQRLLHLGLFPMLPMPDADHCISNGSMAVHQQFLDYAGCFRWLRGREWVLRPHAVDIKLQADVHNSHPGRKSTSTASSLFDVASLAPCDANNTRQLWTNRSTTTVVGMLASAFAEGKCLEVQNNGFSSSACARGTVGSHIIVYPCGYSSDPATELLHDCPSHENIIWKLTGYLLRSGVPSGGPSSSLVWDTCLAAGDAADQEALVLKHCNESDPAQLFTSINTSGAHIQLMHSASGLCISDPPPPPPAPILSPIVNLFRDQSGAEFVVITSPGAVVSNTTTAVVVTVRGSRFGTGLRAEVVRPGEQAPTPLTTLKRGGSGEVVITVELGRGAAVVRLFTFE